MEDQLILEKLGDNVFPNIQLKKNEIIERNGMRKYPSYFSKKQITAFTLSMKSLQLLYNQQITEANDLSMKALKYDITSIDSFQTLIQTASFFIDIETKICLYMQLISLYKSQHLKKIMNLLSRQKRKYFQIKRLKNRPKTVTNTENKLTNNAQNCESTNQISKEKLTDLIFNGNKIQSDDQNLIEIILQPYFRLLFSLGETSSIGDSPVLAMQCYEEVLRFDFENQFAANNLIVSYVKIIGMRKRGIRSIPKRTMWHLKIALDMYDSILEDEVKLSGKLVISYYYKNRKKIEKKDDQNGHNLSIGANDDIYDGRAVWDDLDDWIEITREFNSKCPKAVSFIFMENKGKSEFPLIPAFQEWLDLVVDMHEILHGKSETFYKYIHEKNEQTNVSFRSRTGKQVMAKAGNEHLEKARLNLRNQNFIDTVNECTLAKKMFTEANYPSNKWYLNSPFPILSNRAAACFHLELWIVVLHDVRFTIEMNPKHLKSYVLMKKVAAAFGLDLLEKKMDEVTQKVLHKELSDREWKCVSKRAIALLSLQAFAMSKNGNLTDENIEH